ncbi:MAG TPA: CPBP family intramembrane glutamic endopeptidase [Thermoanaerobaculia bacterium]
MSSESSAPRHPDAVEAAHGDRGGPVPAATRSGRLAWLRSPLLQLLVGYATIQMALWTSGAVKFVAMAAAYVGIIAAVLLERVPASELGFGQKGLRESLWMAPAALGLGGLMVLIGWRFGSLHGLSDEAIGWRVLGYVPWALAQQVAALCFFFRRLERLLRGGTAAVVVTAVLFAGAHVPNPVLMSATLIAEFLWSLAYRRYRNIYAISLAHAILAVAVTVSVPVVWHHSMRVGSGYLLYRID